MDIPLTTVSKTDVNRRTVNTAVFNYPAPAYVAVYVRTDTNVITTNRLASTVTTKRSGVKTSGFHQILRSGGFLPCNAFEYSTKTALASRGWSLYRESYQAGRWSVEESRIGPFGDTSFDVASITDGPTASQIVSLDNQTVIELRKRLKDMSVNVAQVLAERNKTAETVAKAARTIAEMVIALKKGDLGGAAGAAGAHVGYRKKRSHAGKHALDPGVAAANAWLELQYAWKPLLMDIHGAAQALAKAKYRPLRGTCSATKVLTTDRQRYVTRSPTVTDVIVTKGTTRLRYTCIWEVSAPAMPDFTGMGLTNPAELAWELLPYSFVVDWLLPVGDWLSSLDATVGLSFSDGSRSIKTEITQTRTRRTVTRSGSGSSRTEYDEFIESSFKEDSVVRTKLFSFPISYYPSFKNPASLTHMISALALLKKAF